MAWFIQVGNPQSRFIPVFEQFYDQPLIANLDSLSTSENMVAATVLGKFDGRNSWGNKLAETVSEDKMATDEIQYLTMVEGVGHIKLLSDQRKDDAVYRCLDNQFRPILCYDKFIPIRLSI